jgi:hypothetical protein
VEIKSKVYEIVKHLKKQEYVRACDTYYKMAIGNAAWPMGVFFRNSVALAIFSSDLFYFIIIILLLFILFYFVCLFIY